MNDRHGERRSVPDDEPAPVVTSKARTAEWVSIIPDSIPGPESVEFVNGNQPNSCIRGGA